MFIRKQQLVKKKIRMATGWVSFHIIWTKQDPARQVRLQANKFHETEKKHSLRDSHLTTQKSSVHLL
jgi:hypothetical protein